jgi:hypothetical protein
MVQLKAIEVLNKMQGYNEPEQVKHQHAHIHVDAGLIEQLRAGYSALAERKAKGAPISHRGRGGAGRGAPGAGYVSIYKGRAPHPLPRGGCKFIYHPLKYLHIFHTNMPLRILNAKQTSPTP